MRVELFDKVQLKSGRSAHIVEIYEQGIAYEADMDDGDGEFATDTIQHKDILYVFAEKSERQIAV